MKKIELSEDFFSGLDRSKENSAKEASNQRESQAVRTILGRQSGHRTQSRPQVRTPIRRPGAGTFLSLPFAMAGHMMNLCASVIRATLSPSGRR